MAIKRYRVTDIEWDFSTDDEEDETNQPSADDLPSEMIVELDISPDDDEDEIVEQVLDAVTDETGWCILNSQIEPIAEPEAVASNDR